jgi:hypothetical protein
MAFKLAKNPTFCANVDVLTPNDKCGHDKSSFVVSFHRKKTSELDRLRGMQQADVLREVVAGWKELVDENGQEVIFSNENLEALLEIPEAVYAMSMAFWQSIVKAKEKN